MVNDRWEQLLLCIINYTCDYNILGNILTNDEYVRVGYLKAALHSMLDEEE